MTRKAPAISPHRDFQDEINLALQLASQATYISQPNPRVGCVICGANGDILGQGHTQHVGSAHAEVMALRDAASRGHDVRGATAYVTLEPCSHQGRTAPCCDAIIEAGISKVVASIEDPNPLVAGRGFARLRSAGVTVEVGPGANASRELNIGFFSRMIRKTPWVRIKAAASLDGSTALSNGVSQWITSPAARADGHLWRARACAVLTGIGTVLDDDPRLDVRELDISRQPSIVVVDSRLQIPSDARLFAVDRPCYIYTAVAGERDKRSLLESRGVKVIDLPNMSGKVDLAAMMRDLADRGVNELHVEAGHKLNGSLLKESLVDELLVYLAPKLLGPGYGMAQIEPLSRLEDATELTFVSMDPVGSDLRILARLSGRDQF